MPAENGRFFAYVISRKRRANQRKKIHGDVFSIQLKTTCKNSGTFEGKKNTQNRHLAPFCTHPFNCYATPFFELQRGVRQGCPLSGILFVIAVEILADSIRDDQSIMGINIKGKEYKLSQYADDTSCFVRDKDSVVKLFEKLNAFKSCSGLELNRSKTEAMWLGKTIHNPQISLALTKCVCLGVCFSRDSEISVKDNFEKKIACSRKMP